MKKFFLIVIGVTVVSLAVFFIMKNIDNSVEKKQNNQGVSDLTEKTMPFQESIDEIDEVTEVENKMVSSDSTEIEDIEKDTNVSDIEKD